MFTFRNVRILFAAALLAAIFCLAGCSTAAQAVPQPAETSRGSRISLPGTCCAMHCFSHFMASMVVRNERTI